MLVVFVKYDLAAMGESGSGWYLILNIKVNEVNLQLSHQEALV